MNILKILAGLLFLSFLIWKPVAGFAQITPGADATSVTTQYFTGPQDSIYIFCGAKGERNASLVASAPIGDSGSYEWLKYNSGQFELLGNTGSTISGLEDGCYRVNITTMSGVNTYTAWVFNSYLENVNAEILKSDCENLSMEGTFDSPTFTYIDLSKLPIVEPKVLNKVQVNWKVGNNVVHNFSTYTLSPPTKNTEYIFEVNSYGCIASDVVNYQSIVTKASFSVVKPDQLSDKLEKVEAPLTVTFTNTSENGETGKFEWFILKVIEGTKDSVIDILYNDTPPSYTFEETGTYRLKLVSKHGICTDTISEFEMDGKTQKEIVIDEAFLDAPNVFTPNGDEKNETFAIKFFSMKSVKIIIFNRWGRIMHKWESNNVRGFYNTASPKGENYDMASVWDGKVGGKLATPGVYYYVAEGIGRDGKKKKANGFFHLFRDK